METLKGAERRVEAGVKCCGQKGQSLPPSPYSGHLECGLLASVLGVEVSVASGHPVSVLGRVVSLSGCVPGFCNAGSCYKTSFKTTNVQHTRTTPAMGPQRRGRLMGWVRSPGTHKPAKRKSACTHRLEVPRVLPVGSARLVFPWHPRARV